MVILKKLIDYKPIFWASCLFLALVTIGSCFWLCLALWFHKPLGELFSFFAISILPLNALIYLAFFGAKLPYRRFMATYWICFFVGFVWFLSLTPRLDRSWQDDVAYAFDFKKEDNKITINHVRNFAWRTEQNYDINWQTREYDLSKLSRADLIISDWGLNDIVHTMVSFGFDDGQYLSFSIETRKEKTENYSSLGGFFRKYELLFIAGDEKDLIYTRSNVRNEQVYIYPITAKKEHLQTLFLSYLNTGQSLKSTPQWYHTLFSNCTTVIYRMIDTISPNYLPKDYRILLAGHLPEYLLEHQLLDNQYNQEDWERIAHINPKVKNFNIGTPSKDFSQAIRSYDENMLQDN